MITSVNVISNVLILKDEFFLLCNAFGSSLILNEVMVTKKIFDGISNVWIRLVDIGEAGYDESDFHYFEKLLLKPAISLVVIEYDEGETAIANVLKIANEISKKWPIIFDNCHGRVYRPDEIDDLVASGNF